MRRLRTFFDRITNPRGEICDGTFAIEVETGISSGYTPGLQIIFCTRVVRYACDHGRRTGTVTGDRAVYVLWWTLQIAAFEPGPP